MNIFAVAVTLLVGLMVILVMTSLLSKSRNAGENYYFPYDHTPHEGHPVSSEPHPIEHHQTQSHDGGEWGGRDRSHDSHYDGSGHHIDSGGGDGGDAGGGEHGAGGE